MLRLFVLALVCLFCMDPTCLAFQPLSLRPRSTADSQLLGRTGHHPLASERGRATERVQYNSACAPLAAGKFAIPEAPGAEKARLQLALVGKNVNNPVFRAELKKELTFFRSCSAAFQKNSEEKATVIAEGKTKQLLRFIDWLEGLSTEVAPKKPVGLNLHS